jgi:hypothetical protein
MASGSVLVLATEYRVLLGVHIPLNQLTKTSFLVRIIDWLTTSPFVMRLATQTDQWLSELLALCIIWNRVYSEQIKLRTLLEWFEVLKAVRTNVAVFWVVTPTAIHRPDDGGNKDLRNVGKLITVYAALQPRRQQCSENSLYRLVQNLFIFSSSTERNLKMEIFRPKTEESTGRWEHINKRFTLYTIH